MPARGLPDPRTEFSVREDGDWATVLPSKTKPKRKKKLPLAAPPSPAVPPGATVPPVSDTGATAGSDNANKTTITQPEVPPTVVVEKHEAAPPLQRPYLRQLMTTKGCIDTTKLLSTNVNVPLGSVLGNLPPSWWEKQAREAATAGEEQRK